MTDIVYVLFLGTIFGLVGITGCLTWICVQRSQTGRPAHTETSEEKKEEV